MPKQKRWELKRELDHARNDIYRAQGKIFNVGKQYEHIHDDYAEALFKIFCALELVSDNLKAIKDLI